MKNKAVEIVNYFVFENYPPEKSTRCKFVIIESSDCLYFVFGPIDPFSYHADLVNRFCTLNEISSHWLEKPHLVEILDVEYKINGGGWLDINPDTALIQIYGYSTAYGGYNPEQLRYIIEKSGFGDRFELSLN